MLDNTTIPNELKITELAKKYPKFLENDYIILTSMHNYIYPQSPQKQSKSKEKIESKPKQKDNMKYSLTSNKNSKAAPKPNTAQKEPKEQKIINIFSKNFLIDQTIKKIDISHIILKDNSLPIKIICAKIIKPNDIYARCYDCQSHRTQPNIGLICAECYETGQHFGHKTKLFLCQNTELEYDRCSETKALPLQGNPITNSSDKPVEEFSPELKIACEKVICEALYGYFAISEYMIETSENKNLPNIIFNMIFDYIDHLLTQNIGFLPLISQILFMRLPSNIEHLCHDCDNLKTINLHQKETLLSPCKCTIFENLIRYKCLLTHENIIKLQDLIAKLISDRKTKTEILLTLVKMYELSFYSLKSFSNIEYNLELSRFSFFVGIDYDMIKSTIISSPYFNNLFDIFDIFFEKFTMAQTNDKLIRLITENINLVLYKEDDARNILSNTNFLVKYLHTAKYFWFEHMYLNYVIEPFDPSLISNYIYDFLKKLIIVEECFLDMYGNLIKHLTLHTRNSIFNDKDFSVIFIRLGEILKSSMVNLQLPDIEENGIFPSNILVRLFTMTYRILYDNLELSNIQQFVSFVFKDMNIDYKDFWMSYLWTTIRTMLMLKVMQKKNYSDDFEVWDKYTNPNYKFLKYDVLFCQMAFVCLDQDAIASTLFDSIFFYDRVRLKCNNNDISEDIENQEKFIVLSHLMLKNKDILTQQSYQDCLNLVDDWLQLIIYILNDELSFINTATKPTPTKSESSTSPNSNNTHYATKQISLNTIISIIHNKTQSTLSLKKVQELYKLYINFNSDSSNTATGASHDIIDPQLIKDYLTEICDIDYTNKRLGLKDHYKNSYDYFIGFHIYKGNIYQSPSIEDELGVVINDRIQRKNLPYVMNHIVNIQNKIFESKLIDNITTLFNTYKDIQDINSSVHSPNFFRIIHMHLDLILYDGNNKYDKSCMMTTFDNAYLNNSIDLNEIRQYFCTELICSYHNDESAKVYFDGLLSRIEKEYIPLKNISKNEEIQNDNQAKSDKSPANDMKKNLIEKRKLEIQEAFRQKQLKALANFSGIKADDQVDDRKDDKSLPLLLSQQQQQEEIKTHLTNEPKINEENCLICNEKIEEKALGIPLIIFHTNFNYDPNEYFPFNIIFKSKQKKAMGKTEADMVDNSKVYIEFTSCGHQYHTGCLKNPMKCPYCKQKLNLILAYQEFPVLSWNNNASIPLANNKPQSSIKGKIDAETTLTKNKKFEYSSKKIPDAKSTNQSALQAKTPNKPPLVSSPLIDCILTVLPFKDKDKILKILQSIRKIITQLCKKSQYIDEHRAFIQKDLRLYKRIMNILQSYTVYLCRYYEDYPVLYKDQCDNIFNFFVEEVNNNTTKNIIDKPPPGSLAKKEGQAKVVDRLSKPTINSSIMIKEKNTSSKFAETKKGDNSLKGVESEPKKNLHDLNQANKLQKTIHTSSKASIKGNNSSSNKASEQTHSIGLTNTKPNQNTALKQAGEVTKTPDTSIGSTNSKRPATANAEQANSAKKSLIPGNKSRPGTSNLNLQKASANLDSTSALEKKQMGKISSSDVKSANVLMKVEEKEDSKEEEKKVMNQVKTNDKLNIIRRPSKILNEEPKMNNNTTIKLTLEACEEIKQSEENLFIFGEDSGDKPINQKSFRLGPDKVSHIRLWAIDINIHYIEYFFNHYFIKIIEEKVTKGSISSSLSIAPFTIYTSYYLYLIFLVGLPNILPKEYFVDLNEVKLKEMIKILKDNTEYLDKLQYFIIQGCKNLLPFIIFHDENEIDYPFNQINSIINNDKVDTWLHLMSPGFNLEMLLDNIYPKLITQEYLIFNIWKMSLDRWVINSNEPIAKTISCHSALIDLPSTFQEFHAKYQKSCCQINGEIAANLSLCLLCGFIACKGKCKKALTSNPNGNLHIHASDRHYGEAIYLNLLTMSIELYSKDKGAARFINKPYTNDFEKSPLDPLNENLDWSQYKLDMNMINIIKRWVEHSRIGAEIALSEMSEYLKSLFEFM